MFSLLKVPTDNIYKFMAISGVWLFAGFIALFFWYVNFDIQTEKNFSIIKKYMSISKDKRLIEKRLNSIKSEKFNENRLSRISSDISFEDERIALEKILKKYSKTYEKLIDIRNKENHGLKIMNRTDVRIVITIYLFVMVFFVYYGFTRWFKKFHLVEEKARILDIEIREATLKKVQLEIKDLKQNKYLIRNIIKK